MRLIHRNDTSLGVALVLGAVMVFHQPLRALFDAAHDVEGRYHLDLIPALTVLSVVFVFHQYRKRQDAQLAATIAAADAARAREQAGELERLVAFGRALANCLDFDAVRHALWQHLPSFARDHEVWVLTPCAGHWDAVLEPHVTLSWEHRDRLERVASDTIASTDTAAPLEGLVIDQDLCFPMVMAGQTVGVVVIAGGTRLSVPERRALAATTTLIGIAIRNVTVFRETRDAGTRDSLTGCFNRAHAFATLENELRRGVRSKHPTSVLMIDIDHFKDINDKYGHLVGDRALTLVSEQLTHVVRSTDVTCRYGGDEFLIILPDTANRGAMQVAENIRQAVAATGVRADQQIIQVTPSIGVATAIAGEVELLPLLQRADRALYDAKHHGRNRCYVANDAGTPAAVVLAHAV